MNCLLSRLTTRAETLPAVGAGWIDVTYRRISGRIVSAVVRPDELPPVELSGIGWRTVVYLQLAGSASELASRAHRLLAARQCPTSRQADVEVHRPLHDFAVRSP
jgi:hypothetical protein